jgi:glucose-fructose oxidoreductase
MTKTDESPFSGSSMDPPAKWRIAGINFDFRHMDHLLTFAHGERNAEVVGVCHGDPAEMADMVNHCGLRPDQVFTEMEACIRETRPEVILLCPATHLHAEWVERVAPSGAHVLIEKPFARSLEQADRMIAAMRRTGRQLAVNWPLAWYPPHRTAKRLIGEGRIGELQEVHFYDGNRSPILDRSVSNPPIPGIDDKLASWFYDPDGGGSLIDYLGYGATLASWFFGGRRPTAITAVRGGDPRLPADEQSVTIARYGDWLSTFQTRWGTFTDPWEHQPQPKCGFVLKGSAGTIANYDYEPTIRVQTPDKPEGETLPVDIAEFPNQNPVQYFLHCLENRLPVEGPISVETSRLGQEIVDAAIRSAEAGKTVSI